MGDGPRQLGEIAQVIRSKNAGPFWITLDVFFGSDADFAHVQNAGVLTAEKIGELYGVDPALVKRFELPEIRAMKFSMPRRVVAGSFADRDLHGGQQHVPLARVPIPLP
jgi:Domain of unknown function (DUF4387)